MTVADLSRICQSIDIKVGPERLWRALTDAAELSIWFQVGIEGEIVPGNEVLMTARHAGHTGERFRVRFLEMTPPKRFVWEWYPGAVDGSVDYSLEARTTVTFTLEPVEGGTRLKLEETGFDGVSLARRAKVYGDNSRGWTEVLGWIQRYAEAQA